MFTKGRNFSSLCETGMKKKKPARAHVFATRWILVYLYTGPPGCFFLLLQCSYGITVYIKLKVWFLVCQLIWTAKFEYNGLKNRPIVRKAYHFLNYLINGVCSFWICYYITTCSVLSLTKSSLWKLRPPLDTGKCWDDSVPTKRGSWKHLQSCLFHFGLL